MPNCPICALIHLPLPLPLLLDTQTLRRLGTGARPFLSVMFAVFLDGGVE